MKRLLVTSCWLLVIGSIPPFKSLSRPGGRVRGMFPNFQFLFSNIISQSNYSVQTTNY